MVWDLQNEVRNARMWGGIHLRSAITDGITIGNRTALQVLSHHVQRSWNSHGSARASNPS